MAFRFLCLGLVCVALLGKPVSAAETYQVALSEDNRVQNPSDRCLWTCLEMLGRHNQIKTLYGASRNPVSFPAHMHVENVGALLKQYKVRCRVQSRYNYDRSILIDSCEKRRVGAGIIIRWRRGNATYAHMVLVIHHKPEGAYFIDPNEPDKVRFADNAYLKRYWDGAVIAVYPD